MSGYYTDKVNKARSVVDNTPCTLNVAPCSRLG